jgi:hypothetical protein
VTTTIALAHELAKLGPVLPVKGKLPMWTGWQHRASREVNGAPEWRTATGVGLLTGKRAGYFVLDVDTDKGGDETLTAWERQCGRLPITWTSRTGSGGLHFFFRSPDFPVQCSAGKLGLGIDIKGERGQVVGAGSRHPSGSLYAWECGASPADVGLACAPEWLLAKLRPQPERIRVAPRAAPAGDLAQRLSRASAYLARIPGAISGAGGHNQTWRAALALLRGFDLSEEDAFALLASEYNPRCDPPWSEKELQHKVQSAARDARTPRGYLLGGAHAA